MKKFFMVFVLVVVSVLTVSAAVRKVQYVKIDTQSRTTIVYFSDGSKIGSSNNEAFRGFFNSLRAGDLIDIEVEPSTYDHLVAARKVGYETPSGMTNGVIISNNSYGYYGYGYGGAGAAVIATKNVGIGYDPYTGVHVRIGNGENGFGAVNIPVRIKSRKVNNSNYTTVNNGGVVTASPATRANVKSVSVDQLTSITSNSVVRTSASADKNTTSKTAPARSSRKVKVYEVGTLPSAM